MQEVQTTFPIGAIIHEQYVVEDLLGKGRYSAVYLVKDQRNNQKLFVLKEVINPGRKDRYRFTFESVGLKRLAHPVLPRVHSIFTTGKLDRAYILADYIEGPNLEIVQRQQPEKLFSLTQVMSFISPIMDAVTYLHSQYPPIIHRDIKPTNIILPKTDDAPMLVDVGSVAEYDLNTNTNAVHRDSSGYRAPEQYSGESSLRTDIYALGATIYTLLTGSVPAFASYRLTQLNNDQPDPLIPVSQIVPSLPRTLAESIQRAMSISSTNRFSSVESFWEILREASNYEPVVQRTPRSGAVIMPEENRELDAYSLVQHTTMATDAALSEENREFDAQLTIHHTSELVVTASSEENRELDTKPVVQQTTEPVIVSPPEENTDLDTTHPLESLDTTLPEENRELDANPTMPQVPEPVVEVPPEETPTPIANPIEQQVPEPVAASSALHHIPTVSECARKPVTEPLQESHPKQPGLQLRSLLVLFITLLVSIGVGTSFWFYLADHHHPLSALPTSAHQSTAALHPTYQPNSKVTPTPTLISNLYPNVARLYTGTIDDIPANTTLAMSLTGIQQQQGNISGHFIGPNGSEPFKGTITVGKLIHFIIMGSAGQTTLSFDGSMQSDDDLGGTYCNPNQSGQCSDYGIWSVSPASTG